MWPLTWYLERPFVTAPDRRRPMLRARSRTTSKAAFT
jgi:hypothetical protein